MGIPPTGKRVEMALVVIAQFDGDKLAHEHIYWDQASVLVQLGLLDPAGLPVVGAEGARSLLDLSMRLNELIYRTVNARMLAGTAPKPPQRSSSDDSLLS